MQHRQQVHDKQHEQQGRRAQQAAVPMIYRMIVLFVLIRSAIRNL